MLFLFNRQMFTYKFDKKLISLYFCSQDIPYEPNCPRVWLSDEQLHIAVGYLYATGSDPAVIDFQHMPAVAYLYGFSVLAFDNPYYVEILFGLALIVLVYRLGKDTLQSSFAAGLTCLLLIADPLFLNLSQETSYELGQTVFLLLYFIFMFRPKDNYVLQGVFLGLMATAKFWGACVFFVGTIALYKLIKRQLDLKSYLLHLLVAFFVFCLIYVQSFINNHFHFNIVFLQLKVLKYWWQHSITNLPLASVMLFTTGFFKSWWGNHGWLRTQPWSFFWPITLITSIIASIKTLRKKGLTKEVFIFLIPVLYLVYLGVQAPFSRYFILILPFSYLSLSYLLFDCLTKQSSKKQKWVF